MPTPVSSAEQAAWEDLLPPAITSPEPRVALVNPLDLGDHTPELPFGARADEHGRRRGSGYAVAQALVGDEEWAALADPLRELLAAQEAPSPDYKSLADRLLRRLPLMERMVMRFRFGIGGTPPMSQLEVATRLGVARRTVQSLEYRALGQLRALSVDGSWAGVTGVRNTARSSDDEAACDDVAA